MKFWKLTVPFLWPVVFAGLIMTGCAVKKEMLPPPSEETAAAAIRVRVTVAQENLRATPNGAKVGQAARDEEYVLIQRRGNWCQVSHPDLSTAWIWAPSLGFEKVNLLSLKRLMSPASRETFKQQISDILGHPTDVRYYSPDIVIYSFQNKQADGSYLFGSRTFDSLELWIDKERFAVLRTIIQLPPFKGTAEELLMRLGLPKKKSRSSDFTRVIYDHPVPQFEQLKLIRTKGDFTSFSTVHAWKIAPDRLQKAIVITKRNAKQDKEKLDIVLTLENRNSNVVYMSPVAMIHLTEPGVDIGSWKIGPLGGKLEPGEQRDFVFHVPVDASTLDIGSLGVAAELISMQGRPVLRFHME